MARADGSDFNILDRNVFNVLYANAYRKLKLKSPDKIHRINLNDLKLSVLSQHDDTKLIRESLERLWNVKISVDYTDDEGNGHTLRCHYLSYSISKIEGSDLQYAFDEILLRFIQYKEVYSLIELKVSQSMTSRHGFRLYEALGMVIRMYNPVWDVTIEDLRLFFELGDDKYVRFDHLKKNVIERAVEDVNRNAPFTVEVSYRRSGTGGKVVGVKFQTKLKLLGEMNGFSEQVKIKGDSHTIDMFDGVTESDRLLPPELRSDTLIEAARLVGKGADISDMRDQWFAAYGTRTHNSPDEMFLSWVRLQADRRRSESLKDVDVDSFINKIMGGEE